MAYKSGLGLESSRGRSGYRRPKWKNRLKGMKLPKRLWVGPREWIEVRNTPPGTTFPSYWEPVDDGVIAGIIWVRATPGLEAKWSLFRRELIEALKHQEEKMAREDGHGTHR